MAEYIKREDAIKSFLDADTDIMADYGPDYGIECGFSRDRVKEILGSLLAADVAEVRHGRWDASDRYKFLDGSTCIRCTECGAALHLDEYQKYHWHYCPNCGALMREDDNGKE